MKNPFLLLTLTAIISGVTGTLWGYWRGINDSSDLSIMSEAVIGTVYYKQIEAGSTVNAQGWFDMKVDFAIDSYIRYDEDGSALLARLFLPELLETRDEYLDRVIEFREKVGPKPDFRVHMKTLIDKGLLDSERLEIYVAITDKRNAFLASKGVSLTVEQYP